ncbi:MAG: hypothetical protein M1826_003749 [Phylliscum demangeonii]|nr:MAG: hypothetical protein M1826_003749 [Phylliscum demangeonii]
MQKRKRTTEGMYEEDLEYRRIQSGKKLAHARKRLVHVLKLAKRHERQRLGKRMTRVTGNGEHAGLVRLEQELEALKVKTLNLPAIAEGHLHKSILRAKDMAKVPDIREHIGGITTTATEYGGDVDALPKQNVIARLYNNKHVKDELSVCLNSIRSIWGIELSSGPITTRPSNHAVTKGFEEQGIPNELRGDDGKDHESIKPSTRDGVEESDEEESEEEESMPISAHVEPSRLPDEPNPLDPSSSVHRDGSEASETHDTTSPDQPKHDVPPTSLSPRENAVSLTKASGERGDTDQARPAPPPARNSTFLPSLMMSGYWSGSESGGDGLKEEEPEVRKNRMGQRARQQLWEQKFGRDAKHLKGQSRKNDWDPRRGATARPSVNGFRGRDDRHGGRERGGRDEARARDGRNGARGSRNGHALERPDASAPAAVTKPGAAPPKKGLHPSWQAARKAKEQRKPVVFQGKKLVFE